MRVLSSLKTKPLGASHTANRALTCSACCREQQQNRQVSAYLTSDRGALVSYSTCPVG